MAAVLREVFGRMAKGKPAREKVIIADRVRPTKATRRRLTDDPLQLLTENERDPQKVALMTAAADEIGKVYFAVVGALMGRHKWFGETGGFEGMPEKLARAHAHRYLPWVRRSGPGVTEALIELIVERRRMLRPSGDVLRSALLDYWNVDRSAVEDTLAWRAAILETVSEKLGLILAAYWREPEERGA